MPLMLFILISASDSPLWYENGAGRHRSRSHGGKDSRLEWPIRRNARDFRSCFPLWAGSEIDFAGRPVLHERDPTFRNRLGAPALTSAQKDFYRLQCLPATESSLSARWNGIHARLIVKKAQSICVSGDRHSGISLKEWIGVPRLGLSAGPVRVKVCRVFDNRRFMSCPRNRRKICLFRGQDISIYPWAGSLPFDLA